MLRIFYCCVEQRLPDNLFMRLADSFCYPVAFELTRYRNWTDRHLALFGKLLLRKGLNEFGVTDPSLSTLKYGDFRRPYIRGDLDFNISHSDGCVICVVSDECRVGVDIEGIRPVDINEFTGQFNERENGNIRSAADPEKEFYKYWTRKEAVLKACGLGLNHELQELDVTGEYAEAQHKRWYLNQLAIEGFAVHVASDVPYESQIIRNAMCYVEQDMFIR